MTDPDSSRSGPRRNGQARRGLLGLFDFFRRTAEHAADEGPEPETAETGELVHQARAFQTLRVDDVMKPRADILAIEKSCGFAEIVARFAEAEHSRMPVYKETLDEPVGVVHMKDVFRLLARAPSRRPKPDDQILSGRHGLVRKGLYVPPSMPAAELLTLMRGKRTHLALVIDEFGGVDGLVTLEDLLETLVGDISDEHDEDHDGAPAPVAEEEGTWLVDGRSPLAELEQAIGQGVDLAPDDVDEEIDTVAGFVTALAGRVPKSRERIEHPDGWSIEVVSADPRRVKRVRVRRGKAAAPPASGA